MTVAFFSIVDARYFIGAVAFLNSLRLAGHDEPVFFTDCGLTEEQRSRLAAHATILTKAGAGPPHFQKPQAPSDHPVDVAVLLDADLIVTRPLGELVERAAGGTIVAFEDGWRDRFHAAWGDLLGLGPVHRRPYLNSGAFFLSRERGTEIFPLVLAAQERADALRSSSDGRLPGDPFYYVDQDVWNTVLATGGRERHVEILPGRLAPHPPFEGLRLVDPEALRCEYPDGTRPYLVHHVTEKPWLATTRANLYARLLPRLLLASDLPLRLEPEELPARLREGRLAAVARGAVSVVAIGRTQRRRLGLRRRLVRSSTRGPG